jgi:hypothetical protein
MTDSALPSCRLLARAWLGMLRRIDASRPIPIWDATDDRWSIPTGSWYNLDPRVGVDPGPDDAMG